MTPKTNDTFIEEKMREFDEKCKKGNRLSFLAKSAKDEIKNFLRLALEEQREDFKKKVEFLPKNIQVVTNKRKINGFVEGYKACRADILSLLSDNKQEK